MRSCAFLIAALLACSGVPAAAQSTPSLSDELRGLLDELEAGERLKPPEGTAERPGPAAEREPNNTIGTANLADVNTIISGMIGSKGDADWWRVRAPRRGALSIESLISPPEIDLAVRLWNSDGAAISSWVNAAAQGGLLATFFDVPLGGEYVLELRDGRNDAESATIYEIALSFMPVPELGEPNDTYGAASEVPINSAFPASILPKGDADWIAVMADDQGELIVQVNAAPPELDLSVRLWNADGAAISSWVSALAVGGPLEARFDLPSSGRYILELRDGRNDQRSAMPFEVALAFKPTGDRGEPNDTIGAATPLGFDDPRSATILPKGEVDWFAVSAERQGELSVELTGSPQVLDLSFRIWDSNAAAISGWFSPLAQGGDNINAFDLPRPGRYYIELRDGRNDARSVEPFQLMARLNPTSDSQEPNDTIGRAGTLRLGEAHAANILPKGDADFYAVDLPEQGALTVSLTESPPDLDLSFRVWNAEVQAITGWYGPLAKGGDNINVVDLAASGRYFVEVRDGRNDGRASSPYRIQLDLEPTGDGFEPNDTIGRAARISLGETVTGSILPKGEVDWYRVDLGRPGKLRASITQSPENLDVSLRFWNADVQAISGWFSPTAKGGPLEAEADAKAPGSYYIEVRDGRNDDRAVAPYSLTVGASAQ